MNAVVIIKDLIDGIDCHCPGIRGFLNVETGIIEYIGEQELAMAEEEIDDEDVDPELMELAEDIVDGEYFIPLPDEFEVNEYRIMEDFCHKISDERIREILCNTIQGKGAFRRFKDTIIKYDLEKDWFRYKEDALREIAVNWCEENDIPYE